MFFPRRGCETCKHRRVKCDRARPVCGQCQKTKLTCKGVVEDGSFIFLDENEYAGGVRKRRRGPNVTTAATTTSTKASTLPTNLITQENFNTKSPSAGSDDFSLFDIEPMDAQNFQLFPALDIPLEAQAIAYYVHIHVDIPYGVPEAMDSHLKYATIDWSQSEPDSVLRLAISAVSHATFGRARRSQAALTVGCTLYSKALVKTNMALRNPREVTDDTVLLSAMLLSFYENSVMDRRSDVVSRDIEVIGSRSFAHHDGAMALLKLRRQRGWPTNRSMELDKLVRRQLMRTLVLRSMPVPPWLRDGSQYDEFGQALELDRFTVIVAKVRHQTSVLCKGLAKCTVSISDEQIAQLHSFLAEAQTLDSALGRWASNLPAELQYTSVSVDTDPDLGTIDRSFNGTIHIYPTVGHAGLWNRYRALRIAVNSVILMAMSAIPIPLNLETISLKGAVKTTMCRLAEDLCESVPFALNMIGAYQIAGKDRFFVTKPPTDIKGDLKTCTAIFLCWPLALVITIPELPETPGHYLRKRLLDVSKIVDDGVLERIATLSLRTDES
ncbi:hypothetical protein K504DRAFT_421231 [Pleomassaria siparia CBS 279.74]|uniref:Zn(2)-C6 fungal-type domain-containing protein n=1 Tax=Pleomassaria siparia CBS 279.74 TaxID=1314801 RepID=A0A6G1KR40_9PLEO|nr:hypothetical protein K504DRAFT_421231 [Pleomassaria siparia CBS 279.74]